MSDDIIKQKLEELYGNISDTVAEARSAATEAGQAATDLGLPKTSVEAAQAETIARVISDRHFRTK